MYISKETFRIFKTSIVLIIKIYDMPISNPYLAGIRQLSRHMFIADSNK